MKLVLIISNSETIQEDIQQDLILRAKNTNILDCFFVDEDNMPLDITGSEIYFMIKDTPTTEDASAKANKKVTSFTDASNGEAEIELTSTDTSSLLGNYVYQIKIKYNSKWYTVAEGNICFQKSIITRES